ncbi:PTS glucose transporter subunit IIA [Enterococcus casseliflavus]|uniref:PTS sugar transporter subunit IIA n=1 Tax=Enterococcus casseliflavus TaxID=37734 RepID=UPI000F4F16F6|nr:PTS glucose transporter subunit IIA [Enterococcus casseliflavus]ROY42812.1 PTS glucose transporter subunit IIA [Enterococcus casseliflavus]
MFNFLKKKKPNDITLYSPAEGELISITEVPDEVFSTKLMGDGYAVKPLEGTIYSPIEGEIANIFPTKHAVTIKNKSGVAVILHMGVDTVSLKGIPFEIYVQEGQMVDQHTKIAKIDLNYLKEKGKPSDIIVVLTNLADISSLLNIKKRAMVSYSSIVGKIESLNKNES